MKALAAIISGVIVWGVTAYLLTERLFEMKRQSPKSKVLVPDHRGEYFSFTHGDWSGALDLIFAKLYEDAKRSQASR